MLPDSAFAASPPSGCTKVGTNLSNTCTCRPEDADFTSVADGSRPAWYWTGLEPMADAPGMQPDGTIASLPMPDLSTCTRQAVLDYFDNGWLITEVLFSGARSRYAAFLCVFRLTTNAVQQRCHSLLVHVMTQIHWHSGAARSNCAQAATKKKAITLFFFVSCLHTAHAVALCVLQHRCTGC